MYALFGGGILIGPRATFADGDPFLAGGGAVDLVDLDEVVRTDPPEREEAGSPNVLGAVALHAAIENPSGRLAGDRVPRPHLASQLRGGLAGIDKVGLLGPDPAVGTLPLAAFTIEDVPHVLGGRPLERGQRNGVRHGRFCPTLPDAAPGPGLQRRWPDTAGWRAPGIAASYPVRPGPAPGTTRHRPFKRFLSAVSDIVQGVPSPVTYEKELATVTTSPTATFPDGRPQTGPWACHAAGMMSEVRSTPATSTSGSRPYPSSPRVGACLTGRHHPAGAERSRASMTSGRVVACSIQSAGRRSGWIRLADQGQYPPQTVRTRAPVRDRPTGTSPGTDRSRRVQPRWISIPRSRRRAWRRW